MSIVFCVKNKNNPVNAINIQIFWIDLSILIVAYPKIYIENSKILENLFDYELLLDCILSLISLRRGVIYQTAAMLQANATLAAGENSAAIKVRAATKTANGSVARNGALADAMAVMHPTAATAKNRLSSAMSLTKLLRSPSQVCWYNIHVAAQNDHASMVNTTKITALYFENK